MPLEPIARPIAGPGTFLRALTPTHVANAIIGLMFAASAPIALVLAAARGHLSEADIAAWFFAAFFVNGLVTIAFSLLYRQPLVFFWTIPGTVLIGPALDHLRHSEVIGAFALTGGLMLILGLSGLVRRVMSAIPLPIVMAMVAGVFLKFGLDWVRAFERDFVVAAAMTGVFFFVSAVPRLATRFPPLILALMTGIAVILIEGRVGSQVLAGTILAEPKLFAPEFTWRATVELVVPLAITVVVVQNGQGTAILAAAGHNAPVNSIAAGCGVGAFVSGLLGATSTCLTGPVNALISGSGDKEGQFSAAVLIGLMALVFGMFAPLFARFMLAAPPAFIATLAGLGMLRILQNAFTIAFKDRFPVGALVTFLVTVSGLAIFNIGAPFWGLVFGTAVSWLLERPHFNAPRP